MENEGRFDAAAAGTSASDGGCFFFFFCYCSFLNSSSFWNFGAEPTACCRSVKSAELRRARLTASTPGRPAPPLANTQGIAPGALVVGFNSIDKRTDYGGEGGGGEGGRGPEGAAPPRPVFLFVGVVVANHRAGNAGAWRPGRAGGVGWMVDLEDDDYWRTSLAGSSSDSPSRGHESTELMVVILGR